MMACLVVLCLLGAAVGLPIALGWMGKHHAWARLLLAGAIPVVCVLGTLRFCRAAELEAEGEQVSRYPLDPSLGSHSVVILPLPGKHVMGMNLSVARPGSGSQIPLAQLEKMEWKSPELSSVLVLWFPAGEAQAGDGAPLLDTMHYRLGFSFRLEYEVKKESAGVLTSTELRVRPNGCAHSDLGIAVIMARVEGLLLFLPAAIGLFFQAAWAWKNKLPAIPATPGA